VVRGIGASKIRRRAQKREITDETKQHREAWMETQDEELIESLTPRDADLKSAYEKHLSLKARVDELESLEHLSDLQEMECAELKKKKLAEKDRVMRILSDHRREREVGQSQSA
jgi:uncharacterized protein YdcH (DUF465 family)